MAVAALSVLLLLFVLRVSGQLLVLMARPRWLPPMKDWYSGLVPYFILLPLQVAIIALMLAMIGQVRLGIPDRELALGLFLFAAVYALGMLVRLIILRRRHPEYRWYEGGMIPILFHWVLAAFLLVYSAARFS